ncbi:CBS domain-containing protein [Halobacillus salinarum]|uniref:CBS domain-containing protein n=1 Tax=Halobacillus salinarum TaxID=2932257 RepID=A0ABY4EFT2_9BACI|nr:CBS domain-containing protein [Halobacillus salinarum]UOQ43312.1 CBS domain-containing protein [Halobacillus salinarum]
MLVKEFMIHDVIHVHPQTSLKELLRILVKHRIGGVPVVNEKEELLGMVSDGDVIRYLSPKEEAVHDLFYTVYVEEGQTEKEVLAEKINDQVEEAMRTKHLYIIREDEEFEQAVRLFSQHHFKKLPVLNDSGVVTGVISRGDIIRNLSKMIIELN